MRSENQAARRGIALLTAVIILVVVGALIAGVFFPATEEMRRGVNALDDQRALRAAEFGAQVALRDWDRTWTVRASPGDAWGPTTIEAADGAGAIVRALRTTPRTAWLTSEGFATLGRTATSGRRQVGVAVRLATAPIPNAAAVTTRGPISVHGVARIDGTDRAPLELLATECPEGTDSSGIGVDASDTTRICDDAGCGAGHAPWITGAPPVHTMLPSADTARGDASWHALARRADIVLAGGSIRATPVIVGGSCARAVATNWGDPRRTTACADHYPIVRVRGDLTLLAGSVGQGILLVEGSLRVEGDARFDGVMRIRDAMTGSGVGARISGAVIIDNLSGAGASWLDGDIIVQRSRCAVDRALLGTGQWIPVPERSWVELFR